MHSKGHRKRHKSSPHGSSPAVVLLTAMLKILVPLGIITLVAAWVVSYRSPGTGGIRITTSIPGADIYIAGTMTPYQSDTTLTGVSVGRQIVTVRKPGYVSEPEVLVVEVRKNRVGQADFILRDERTLARADTIAPLSSVRQEIFSTGEPVAQIPPSFPPARSRRLIDYSQRVRTQTPEPAASLPAQTPVLETSLGNRNRDYSSDPALPSTSLITQITVSSIPDGASIIVNGNPTQRVTPYTFRGLDYGAYVFRLSKPGYISAPESIMVMVSEQDETELVSFNLAPDQALPKPTLTVQTTPAAAGVKVDGRSVGVGSATLNIEFGTHKVEFLEVPGYRAPAPVTVDVTADDPHQEITGRYERLLGNSYLAVLPGEDAGIEFDGSKLRIFVDNELLLDGPKQNFDATLMGRIPAGKRLVRVQYGDLVDDIHVNLQDGEVCEVTFRVESFFSKRRLRLRDRDTIPLDRWEQRSRRLTVLSAS